MTGNLPSELLQTIVSKKAKFQTPLHFKGWMTRHFLADQNQRVSKPT